MRIAIVQRRYSLDAGGAERYCVNLCRTLQGWGHSVSVVGERIDEALAGEVALIQVDVNHSSSWSKTRSFDENVARRLKKEQFDVVLALGRSAHADVFHVTSRVHARWMQIRYGHPIERALQRLNPRHRAVLEIERKAFSSNSPTRHIVVQSELDRHLLMRLYGVAPDRIRLIRNGVDTTIFNPSASEHAVGVRERWGIRPTTPLAVFVSATDFRFKGLGGLIQALRLMRERDTRLLVVGRGPVQQFARIARRMGLADRLIFVGYQRQVERFYAAADICVLPTAYEPFPNVILESMACGVPVITTATNGGAEIVVDDDTGYVVAAHTSANEIASRMDRFMTLSQTQRDRMSLRCWETAGQLNLETHAAQMVSLFEEIRDRGVRCQPHSRRIARLTA